MPFSATHDGEGVKFRIWAPGTDNAQVKLFRPQGDDLRLPMEKQEDGFFSLSTNEATTGSLYLFDFGGGRVYPDPASRRQPEGIHGPSEVVDPCAFDWQDTDWHGRPWNETIIYELHVGTFSEGRDFGGVQRRLDHLQKLGVTALEIMPVAKGPGTRGWGYDGTYLFAPETSYGTPEDLKRLIQAAHQRDMQVFLDVVYNHFGPEGNYIGQYAPQFFTARHKTPWGDAINYDQPGSEVVREFYCHNALYWLEEYRFDGLRFDAIHTIKDDSKTHIFDELTGRIHELARRLNRHIHLIAENEDNGASLLSHDAAGVPQRFTAQWNDDFHHPLHALMTQENDAFFEDYAEDPVTMLGKSLTEGFVFQGQASKFRKGKPRGEPTTGLHLAAFINFLQNHDQIGNRPFGERLISLMPEAPLRAVLAVLLLTPSIPMLFMGEEWGSRQPFPYFCDFGPELSEIVRTSRIKEFAIGSAFESEEAKARIPDPTARETFDQAILDWAHVEIEPYRSWFAYYRKLIALRSIEIVPLMDRLAIGGATVKVKGKVLLVKWPLIEGGTLVLEANLGEKPHKLPEPYPVNRQLIFATQPASAASILPGWSVVVGVDKA
jgi:maltooligosyltrehalose trehalohydrolase